MKNQRFLNYLFWGLVVFLSSVIALVIFGATRHRALAPLTNSPGNKDERPLKERAKLEGHVIKTENQANSAVFGDLSGLAAGSSEVVIGIARTNSSRLTADGMSAVIDYQIAVEYVYKGKLREGDIIKVSVPGGFVKFADGSTAEVRTPWFRKLQNGKTYALFLSPKGEEHSFVVTGEAEGVFDVPTTSASRGVKTHAGVMNDPMRVYEDMDVRKFLREVRQAVTKGSK